MINEVSAKTIRCPYCGERLDILVDGSLPEQEYVEDCSVCCRPMLIYFELADGEILAITDTEKDEVITTLTDTLERSRKL